MSAFTEFTQTYTQRINDKLNDYLTARTLSGASGENNTSEHHPSSHLDAAMRYSLLSGGKRIRPLLAYASAEAIGEANPLTDRAAAAIECIHAYSLIHDDLPAMDDDDLRRGQATCHIEFDEATAILAGDALQAYAFELLSQPIDGVKPMTQLQMCQLLATASGANGMVAGQAIDLAAINQELNLEQLSNMHSLKTGALISASVLLGAISTGLATEKQQQSLSDYASAIGLAFQVQDDILDVTSDTETLGKQQGADISHNKPTFVSLLGLDSAKQKADKLYNTALDSLSSFDYRADHLRHLAGYIVKRKR